MSEQWDHRHLLKTSCSILGISYHVGTMSIWQYSGHIVTEAKQMEAEADLRGTIGMMIPEAKSSRSMGAAQLCQTTSIAKEVPSLMICICGQKLSEDINSVDVSLEYQQHATQTVNIHVELYLD